MMEEITKQHQRLMTLFYLGKVAGTNITPVAAAVLSSLVHWFYSTEG